jgi:hypothetical protein
LAYALNRTGFYHQLVYTFFIAVDHPFNFWQSSADITQGSIFKIVTRGRVVAKTWVKEKIDSIKKKTSIGNSHLSNGSGTNKRRTKKVYRGQGK